MRRHLKILIAVNGDEKEEGAHVCLIICDELLSREKFSCLDGRKN